MHASTVAIDLTKEVFKLAFAALSSRPNTRLQPHHFPTIENQPRQTCLTEESIHELLGAISPLLDE